MLVSSVLRPGAVPVPRWILALRALQLLFALLVIGLASYCFSTNGGGVVRLSHPPQPPRNPLARGHTLRLNTY